MIFSDSFLFHIVWLCVFEIFLLHSQVMCIISELAPRNNTNAVESIQRPEQAVTKPFFYLSYCNSVGPANSTQPWQNIMLPLYTVLCF